ncbi:uncharacterized protein B0P05DRAFT_596978 [Gilbertella persicaria]|uniref:uncharacterized protein n=1 Tax=Gilbertella persicaria TaxID=101096 RepID=UPI0022206416|nr:uncharacterized protein B0P05DRAFT_596978 [Gilbertella persicaria]KAI8078151.1 hypothetical protein B0P05DRAFT_596978 [Gilbertella persicaria]
MMDFTNKALLKRIASASQEKVYPSVHSKTEIPLRKILLSSRLWESVRKEQEKLSELESKDICSDEDWWFATTDETLEALVSFASEPSSPLNNDPESPSALLDLDYNHNLFLNNNDAPTTNTAHTESSGWSWLEEESSKINATQNLLSHTLHMDELVEDDSEEDEEEDLLNVNNNFLNTQPNKHEEEEEEDEFNNEEWLAVHETTPIKAQGSRSTKRKREVDEDDQERPSKKLSVREEAIDLLAAAALLTSNPPGTYPTDNKSNATTATAIASPLLRV